MDEIYYRALLDVGFNSHQLWDRNMILFATLRTRVSGVDALLVDDDHVIISHEHVQVSRCQLVFRLPFSGKVTKK